VPLEPLSTLNSASFLLLNRHICRHLTDFSSFRLLAINFALVTSREIAARGASPLPDLADMAPLNSKKARIEVETNKTISAKLAAGSAATATRPSPAMARSARSGS
jgi:hypothetical protein